MQHATAAAEPHSVRPPHQDLVRFQFPDPKAKARSCRDPPCPNGTASVLAKGYPPRARPHPSAGPPRPAPKTIQALPRREPNRRLQRTRTARRTVRNTALAPLSRHSVSQTDGPRLLPGGGVPALPVPPGPGGPRVPGVGRDRPSVGSGGPGAAADRYTEVLFRRFLVRRHQGPGRGTRPFSNRYLYDELGLVRLDDRRRMSRLHALTCDQSESRMRENRTSVSMSGSEKPGHGRAKALPEETGSQRIGPAYRRGAWARLYRTVLQFKSQC
jgi:hypothetical protein